jgi:hypothetical protein
MSDFCKNEDCPASQELLDFQNGDLPIDRTLEIGRHLATCEFCEAEADFYSHYPQIQEDEVAETEAIPAPLFELAEALLTSRHTSAASLERLLSEDGEFAFRKN